MPQKSQKQTISDFIFQSVDSGYTCILIGEQHSSKKGLEALDEIAFQLQEYTDKINGDIQFVIFNETGDYAADEVIAMPCKGNKAYDNLNKHGILVYGLENKNADPRSSLSNNTIEYAYDFLKKLIYLNHL